MTRRMQPLGCDLCGWAWAWGVDWSPSSASSVEGCHIPPNGGTHLHSQAKCKSPGNTVFFPRGSLYILSLKVEKGSGCP